VPFGEFTGFQYIALGVTNPTKWHPVTRPGTKRDLHYGSEEPEVGSSNLPPTTNRTLCTAGGSVASEAPEASAVSRGLVVGTNDVSRPTCGT
jgi:hypothetical protein